MPSFGRRSLRILSECDERIQIVLNDVVRVFDCAVICGYRDEETQEELHRQGKSHVQWPDSKHNTSPSLAVDVIPWPVDWADRERFNYFAGYVMGTAVQHGIDLRWGGDWNRDWMVRDNSFDDLPHFELLGP